MEMEESLFADDAFLDHVEQVKASLLQREAAGQLAPSLSAALALQLQRSPRLREQMQQARLALKQQHDQHHDQEARQPTALTQPQSRPLFAWRIGLGLAGAAALLAVVTAGVLRTERTPKTLPPPLAATPRNPSAAVPPPQPAPPAMATVLFLPAGILRGPADAPAFRLPESGRPVELQIQVRGSQAKPARWSATLVRDGRAIVSGQLTSAASEGSIRYVSLPLPAGLLIAGTYRLTLSPADSTAAPPVERTLMLREK